MNMTLKEMALASRNNLIKAIEMCKNNDSELLRMSLIIAADSLLDEDIVELGEALLKLHNKYIQKEYGDMN